LCAEISKTLLKKIDKIPVGVREHLKVDDEDEELDETKFLMLAQYLCKQSMKVSANPFKSKSLRVYAGEKRKTVIVPEVKVRMVLVPVPFSHIKCLHTETVREETGA
jgi:hypothetical protein